MKRNKAINEEQTKVRAKTKRKAIKGDEQERESFSQSSHRV